MTSNSVNNSSDLDQPPTGELRPPMTTRTRLLIGGAVMLLIGAGALWWFGGSANPEPDEQTAAALTVTATKPQTIIWPETIAASGAVAAWQEASIGTQIGSYQLVDVRVNVGDHVRRGEVLARLDPALLRAEEAELLARHEQAEANRKRALGMQGSGAISEQEILRFVTEARTAAAALAAKRTQLRYTDVVSPDSGTISARTATLGSVVPAGQELFRLIRQDRLEWRGEVTAAQLGRVRIGQPVGLELPDGRMATGKVRQIAPSLGEETRLAIVYTDILRGSPARAGMFATGKLALGESPALTIPAESVVIRDGRSQILVLNGGDAAPRVSLRSVRVGRREGNRVEIVEGLRMADRVVVRGAGFLKDRDLVRVVAARPSESPAP